MSEVAARADFSAIRYAQCWEDADILVEALRPGAGKSCLSIASAGDNVLALASRGARVVAVDLNPAQLHCLALRVAAYRELSHGELLDLIGSRPSDDRRALYRRVRDGLDLDARHFWDHHLDEIDTGIGGAGKFERYFALFRNRALPLVHSRRRVESLLEPKESQARQSFYDGTWNIIRWRLLFSIFFSRTVMGALGRSPAFFKYVEGSVADRILERTRFALTTLDPSANPYLTWILTGTHGRALPYALREEHFEAVRKNLDNVSWHLSSIETYLDEHQSERFDGFNLSDIFEYQSEASYTALFERLVESANPGARFAYWNMLVPRRCPAGLAGKVKPLPEESARLFALDNAFFYSAFVVEEAMS